MKGEGKEGRQGEQWEDKGWKWGGGKKKRVRKGESKGKGVAGGRWEKKEKREWGEETV